ncbi:hypothetical protein GE21DRAFT_1087207 [Neurospora crassa]|nr:hypothetical protein GE21DRAFT_1087207 [Neurospora crassa]
MLLLVVLLKANAPFHAYGSTGNAVTLEAHPEEPKNFQSWTIANTCPYSGRQIEAAPFRLLSFGLMYLTGAGTADQMAW